MRWWWNVGWWCNMRWLSYSVCHFMADTKMISRMYTKTCFGAYFRLSLKTMLARVCAGNFLGGLNPGLSHLQRA
eukprot:jgi/Botrbrau1/8713/Bobra.0311s0024.1